MLEITCNSDRFRAIFALPAAIRDHGVLNVGPPGLRVSVIDPAHYFALTLKAMPGAFTSYKCDLPEEIGMPFGRVAEYLSRIRRVERAGEISATFSAADIKLKHGRTRFNIKRLAVISEMRAPDASAHVFPHTAVANSKARELANMAEAAIDLAGGRVDAGSVRFVVRDEHLFLSANDDNDSLEIDVGEAYSTGPTPTMVEPCEVVISVDYLSTLCSALPNEEFQVTIGTKLPLGLSWESEGDTAGFGVRAFVAPRIGED